MQNVAPTRRLGRRSRDMMVAAGLVFLVGAGVVVAGITLHILNLVVASNPSAGFYDLIRKALLTIGIGLIISSFLMALRAITWKTDNQLAWQLGAQLATHLDRNHVFIRNISKRSTGYVDAVLVSKHGILVLRIIGRKGKFGNDKGHWLKRRRQGNWIPMRWNPTQQVMRCLNRIRAYLQVHGLGDLPLFAVIVFTREPPLVELTLNDPAVPVTFASHLLEGLRDTYFARSRLDATMVQRVVNLLYQ